MIDRIAGGSVEQLTSVVPLHPSSGTAAGESVFSQVLRNAIERVEATSTAATAAAENFVSGDVADLHSAALATQRAALQFEYVLQVRNKVVQAYQEIMRMQL